MKVDCSKNYIEF